MSLVMVKSETWNTSHTSRTIQRHGFAFVAIGLTATDFIPVTAKVVKSSQTNRGPILYMFVTAAAE